ncbi:MAG: hypothetical protein K0U98_09645 [Deltaproteobacteria bacterium]|nr:hypothetical protein [Deltaproteobacteria bacterium]
MRSDHVLRFYDSVSLDGGGTVADEVMIFRDGLTILRRTGSDFDPIVARGQASLEDISMLKQVLVEERVDRLMGGCELTGLPSVQPIEGAVASREILLSWFGVAGRRARHMEIDHVPSEEPGPADEACSDGLARVASVAVTFSEQVLSQPDATFGPDMNYPRSLLYEIDNQFVSDPDCELYTFSDTFLLFRDGLLLRRFKGSDGSFEFTRGIAQRDVRDLLIQALADEIQDLRGICRTWFFIPFTVDGACVDYSWNSGATWFGRQGRMTTLQGNEGISRECSDGQLRVRTQLVILLVNTLANPSNDTVSGFFTGAP